MIHLCILFYYVYIFVWKVKPRLKIELVLLVNFRRSNYRLEISNSINRYLKIVHSYVLVRTYCHKRRENSIFEKFCSILLNFLQEIIIRDIV